MVNVYKELKSVVEEGGLPIHGQKWLTESSIPIYSETNSVSKLKSHQDVIQTLPFVFNDMLGCYKHKMFDLILKKNFKPIFHKSGVLPFTLRDKVSDEIERLVNTKLLIPIKT